MEDEFKENIQTENLKKVSTRTEKLSFKMNKNLLKT